MLKLINPKIKGRLLVNDNEDIPLIKLPIGCIANRRTLNDYNFKYSSHSNVEKLIATSKKSSESIELLPIYYATDYIVLEGKKIDIIIRELIEHTDYCVVNSIIESTHYLKPPYKGLTIVAEFKNKNDKELILTKSISSQNEYSDFEKIIAGFSNIAGCAIIDQMTYANPKGRKKIAEELNCNTLLSNGSKWKDNHRDEVLKLLKVAWISRFAISKLYQGLGIGTILAKHAAVVAGIKIIPQVNFVEVFTTHPKQRAQEILESDKKGFLKKAGYKIFNELLYSKPKYNSEDNNFSVNKKLYYYKRVDEVI